MALINSLGYVTGMLQYVGQQRGDRQGWGNQDEAEERVRLHVDSVVHTFLFYFFFFFFPGFSHSIQLCAHTVEVQVSNATTRCRGASTLCETVQ